MWWFWSVKNFENNALYLNGVSPKMRDCEKKYNTTVYFNHFLVSLELPIVEHHPCLETIYVSYVLMEFYLS